jgi:hypothetical protein
MDAGTAHREDVQLPDWLEDSIEGVLRKKDLAQETDEEEGTQTRVQGRGERGGRSKGITRQQTISDMLGLSLGDVSTSDSLAELQAVKKRLSIMASYPSRQKKCNLILDPTSRRMRAFDLALLFALLFTSMFTPYEVALLPTALNTRFVINWCVDAIYIIDMLRSFVTPFENKMTGLLVKDQRRIVLNYLATWFCIDAIR